LKADASTYSTAEPIVYSLVDADPYFSINNVTGDVYLVNNIDVTKKGLFSFKVVATDSAVPMIDRQSVIKKKLIIKNSILIYFLV
jgi:hypothetical protein